jgi:hypothetical protein
VIGAEIYRRRPQRPASSLFLAPKGVQPPIRLGNVTLKPEELKRIKPVNTGFGRVISLNSMVESFLSLHQLVITSSHGSTPRETAKSGSAKDR